MVTAALTPASVLASEDAAQLVVPLYRVNAGGPLLSDSPLDWSEDTSANPSPFFNVGAAGNFTFSNAFTGTNTTGAPDALFSTERYDMPAPAEMAWEFPAANGDYAVRLYFAEIWSGTQNPGDRVFDITIEGTLVEDDYDIVADVGFQTAVVKEYAVTVSDGGVSIDFGHVVENPAIKGIEIIPVGVFSGLTISKEFTPAKIKPGEISTLTFTIINSSGTDVTGVAFIDDLPTGVEVAAAPNATGDCNGGTFSAPAAATTVSLSGGALINGSNCVLSVDVTAPAKGTYDNLTSAVTSNETPDGNQAAATLNVRTSSKKSSGDKKDGGGKKEEVSVLPAPSVLPELGPADFIGKTVDKELAQVGDVVTYTIIASNPKDVTLTEVVIKDVFDSRLARQPRSSSEPRSPTGSPLAT